MMHLCHRSGGKGRRVQFSKNLFNGPLEFLLDDLLDLGKRYWWNPILQLSQLFNVFSGKYISPCTHQLSQLDKAGPQFFQYQTNAAW